ncbi:MAG: CRISPR-associated endoribonuclease Cas6 [Sporomusaceae bacterium]|nr:CRISPR-associated endoribonuclease Cas6 [Sporomusaceae bacterium]
MHVDIYFRVAAGRGLVLPVNYNYIVQSALYHSLNTDLASFLHEKGYSDGSRTFKLFCFSLLQGPYHLDKTRRMVDFGREVKLTVSSPLGDFCQSLVTLLMTRGSMRLGTQDVFIDRVQTRQLTVDGERAVVRTLSPAVLYSTMPRPDERQFTVYFQPGEPDYNRLFNENLQKKHHAFSGGDSLGTVAVRPLGLQKMKLIVYQETIIKAYAGTLVLTGPQPLLQLAVDAGIGSKNNQGFGCVELAGQ